MSEAIRIERVIPAPPERVYRAWLEPEVLAKWAAPVGWSVADCEVEERAGGRYRCRHLDPGGTDMGGFEAEIAELVPNERIVLKWHFVGPDRATDPATETRLTLLFDPAPDGATAVTLIHDELDGLAAAHPFIAENIEGGWTGTVGRLAEVLA